MTTTPDSGRELVQITVVIPNWNGGAYLPRCLQALGKQTFASFETIVVDNGSTDGSADTAAACFPTVDLVRLDRNLGFAGGVNRGIRAAMQQGADAIVLLNNDTEPEPDWLRMLVGTAREHPECGSVTSKMVRTGPTRRLDGTGDGYSTWGFAYPRGRDEIDNSQYDAVQCRDILGCSGGASLFRTELFDDIGLFDESFFAYYEDVDLALRARLAGWQARYEPLAVVRHEVEGTSRNLGDFRRYHLTKNFPLVYVKNMPGPLFVRHLPTFLAGFAMLMCDSATHGQLGAAFRGLAAGARVMPGALRQRREIQRRRRIAPMALDQWLLHRLPPHQDPRRRFRQRATPAWPLARRDPAPPIPPPSRAA